MSEAYKSFLMAMMAVLLLLAAATLAAIWLEGKSKRPAKEKLLWIVLLAVFMPFAVLAWAYVRFWRQPKAGPIVIGGAQEARKTDRFGNFI